MARTSLLQMRMALLTYGEKMGWPRLPVRFGVAIRPGEPMWTRFAASRPAAEIAAAHRVVEVRVDYLGDTAPPPAGDPVAELPPVAEVPVPEPAKAEADLASAWDGFDDALAWEAPAPAEVPAPKRRGRPPKVRD